MLLFYLILFATFFHSFAVWGKMKMNTLEIKMISVSIDTSSKAADEAASAGNGHFH